MGQFIYYVYAYLRKDGTPYYIGKGKGKRAWSKNHNLNIPAEKYRIIFLETNLSDVGSLALERRMIRWYGRKDLGTGILQNRTDGGEGSEGLKHTDASKLKISIKNKGRILGSHTEETNEKRRSTMMGKNKGKKLPPSWNNGIPMREETKLKQSISHMGKIQSAESHAKRSATLKATHASKYKPIMTPRGRFDSIEDVMKEYGVTRGTVSNYIWKHPENFYRIK